MVSRCLSKAKTHIYEIHFFFVFRWKIFTCCASLGFLPPARPDPLTAIQFLVFPHSTPTETVLPELLKKKVEKFINFHAVAFGCFTSRLPKTISTNFFCVLLCCFFCCCYISYDSPRCCCCWMSWRFSSAPETKTQQTLLDISLCVVVDFQERGSSRRHLMCAENFFPPSQLLCWCDAVCERSSWGGRKGMDFGWNWHENWLLLLCCVCEWVEWRKKRREFPVKFQM